jgi:hypothetical protein
MNEFKRHIFMTEVEDYVPPSLNYCVTWEAHNLDNIKMSLSGTIDFTEELGARNIDTGASIGAITSYVVNGTTIPSSIPMTFTLKKANFSTATLDAVMDSVLTVITFYVEIICNDSSDISVGNTLAAMEGDPLNSSFDSCV